MKSNRLWIIAGSVVALIALTILIVVRVQKPPEVSAEFFQTAEGTHMQIQDLETVLTQALNYGNFEAIHDHMYYAEGLIQAFQSRIDPAQLEDLGDILNNLSRATQELDYFAGRGNMQATHAGVRKFVGLLHQLKSAYRPGDS